MKKLILFLLLPLWVMAQTSNGQETEFDYGIKNNSTQTITTPTYLTTTGTDGTQGKIPSAYIEKTDSKQNSLVVDGTGTKYPTVDAVNAALPKTYTTTVYVNTTSPNTATIFDDENPPTVNDNALKSNTDNLYIGSDASTWVYNGSTYVTKVVPATSNFFIRGTTVDAGNSKTENIERSGNIKTSGSIESYEVNAGNVIANNFIKSGGTSSQFLKADGSVDSTTYQSLLINPITGVGTADYIPKFTSTNSIGNSIAYFSPDGLVIQETNPFTYSSFTLKNDLSTNAIQFGIYNSLHPNANKGFIYGSGTLSELGFYVGAVKRLNILDNGNLLVNTTTDNGVDKLQVNGSISATSYTGSATLTGTPTAPTAAPGTNTTQVATTAFVQANSNANGILEFNSSNATIWNNGKGNIVSNTSFGRAALELNTTGSGNSAFGHYALSFNSVGTDNVAIGERAGAHSGSIGGFQNNGATKSVYIGSQTVAKGNNESNDNEIVIGYGVIGNGSNSTTLGNDSIVGTYLKGKVIVNNVIRLKNYTVSTLPAGAQGDTAYVTDATAPTYLGTLTGGGSVVCPVFYNGTAWVAH